MGGVGVNVDDSVAMMLLMMAGAYAVFGKECTHIVKVHI